MGGGTLTRSSPAYEVAYRETHRAEIREHHRRWRARHVERIALRAARDRCTNPNDRSYPDYGGRGIRYEMPEDLREATTVLIAAIGRRPEGMSLDRIDNEGHYRLGNLRWATKSEQSANQRRRRD